MFDPQPHTERHLNLFSRRALLILTGVLLLLAAAGLGLRNWMDQRQAGLLSKEILARAEAALLENSPSASHLPEGTADGSSNLSVPDNGVQTASWEGYDIIGILSLPDLGLTLPVLGAYQEDLLKAAPCVFAGSWENGPQGLVIAGHNYQTHFHNIGSLTPEAKISFQALDGTLYPLQIAQIEEIGADEPDKLDAAAWDITLLTCNPDRSKRILVRCCLTEYSA